MDRSACLASCSTSTAATPVHVHRRRRHSCTAAKPCLWQPSSQLRDHLQPDRVEVRHRPTVTCWASQNGPIQGYTPANYISYTDTEQHQCHHMLAIEVEAPVSICFDLWDDWCRLVDFLDLVSQIGLDPDEPDMGLFQCFYRWGRMPVMEIVFLARKVHVTQDELIAFDTVWGMPASGEISFVANSPTSTTVMFKLEHQMPWLLVDLKVGALAVETQLRQIFSENLLEFKELAEKLAKDPSSAPARQPASTKRQRQQQSRAQQGAANDATEQDSQASQGEAEGNQGSGQASEEPPQQPGPSAQQRHGPPRPGDTWDAPAKGIPQEEFDAGIQPPNGLNTAQVPMGPPPPQRRPRASRSTTPASPAAGAGSGTSPPAPPAKRAGGRSSTKSRSQPRTTSPAS